MGLTKWKLGELIKQRREKNNSYDVPVRGVSREGFINPKQARIKVNDYNVFYLNDFVFNSARMELNSIALNTTLEKGLCSPLYDVFYIVKPKILLPAFLNLYIKRDEFARHCSFLSFGSAHNSVHVDDLAELTIDLPSLTIQQKYVDVYNAMLANQQAYEQGLEDLKLTCDVYIERLQHEYPSVTIKKLIAPIDERNTDSSVTDFYGININKEFMPTVANTDGVNSKNYKIVRKNRFVFSGMQTGRDKSIRIGLYSGDAPIIVSPAYTTFEIASNKILPEYFFMLFRRTEMDRLGWFLSDSSVRSNLDWERFCEITIGIPPIKVQQYIVNIFTVYQLRREINEQLKAQIKDLCPILIKGSLEEAMRI